MKTLLSQPGYISSANGGQRLRELYREESMNLNPAALSPFALSVFVGDLDLVKQAVERGMAPDLMGTETPFKTSYASLVILGAQRMCDGPPGSLRHLETLEYLFSKGLPPDVEDIVGFTALHHATTSPPCTIDILMEYGADLDIPDADGWTARKHFLACGPQVTAAINKWIRKRTGEEAPRAAKACDACGKIDASLKNCGKCRVARYCSSECQGGCNITPVLFYIHLVLSVKAWPSHKKTCQPFSASNTVTLKPYYNSFSHTIPIAEFTRKSMGHATQSSSWSQSQTRGAHVPKNLDRESKTLVIKVQVPNTLDPKQASTGDLLLYTKKRDFACTIRRSDTPADYDRISQVVRTKGVGGKKAYFAAELESKDKLVVKISEVLAEQPW
ncbi:ankyrin [Mycena galopus ATCC 62051]|nr:ankyrin [Mycena galopus ATCC 62051]